MYLSSSFSNNAVILISSSRAGEENVGRRLAEDLDQLRIALHDFHLEHHNVTSRQDLVELLRKIARQAKKGLRPIIHFDMHGDQHRGLELNPSRDFATWPELVAWLRRINKRTRNNLCVVAASCYGLQMIRPISIHNAVPFYCLIAPEKEVSLGFVDQKMSLFYRQLLEKGSLEDAFREIEGEFQQFHCEKMLTIVLTKYIKQQCKGAGFMKRKEQLISGAVARGAPRTAESLKRLRHLIRETIRPSESLIQKYASQFLIGREYPVSLDQITRLIEESY